MNNYSIVSDGYPTQTQERINEYRLKQKKDGILVLQQKVIIKNYEYGHFQGMSYDWIELETVKEVK